jgi:tetratricopeptide (TPR) repeat protein
MYYSLGDTDPKMYNRAVECFSALIKNPSVPRDAVEMARYRLAKTYEKQGRADAAIKEYLDVVYQYGIDLKEGKARDWFYFTRSGYDAAQLLLLNDRFHEAARIYERLAAAKIPTAAAALAKAAEIRAAHKLND